MPRLLYQFSRLFHLSVRNNFLTHQIFNENFTLLHESAPFPPLNIFFSGTFLISFSIWILCCPEAINLGTSVNTFMAWISVSSVPNFESVPLPEWSTFWSIHFNLLLFYFTISNDFGCRIQDLKKFYCRIYRYCSTIF